MLDKRKLDLVGRVQLIDQFFRFLEMRLQVPFRQIIYFRGEDMKKVKINHVTNIVLPMLTFTQILKEQGTISNMILYSNTVFF